MSCLIAEPFTRLCCDDQWRVQNTIRSLAEVWQSEDQYLRLARVMSRVFVESAVLYYTHTGEQFGSIVHTATGDFSREWEVIRAHDVIQTSIQYDPRRRDERANKPLILEEVFPEPEGYESFQATVFRPNGFSHQLRTVLFDQERFVGYFAFINTSGMGDYGQRHRDFLSCLIPSLVDGLGAVHALGDYPLSIDSITNTLETYGEPAFLVSESGDWLFANKQARELYTERPEWLPLLGSGATSPLLRRQASVTSIDISGRLWRLVIPRPATNAAADDSSSLRRSFDTLPRRLAQVARALTDGLSDKEIAQRLDISLATARSYSHSVLQRLGVKRRRDLVNLVLPDEEE